MSDLTPFNPQNWPINVQVLFEPWGTIPCARLLTYMMTRKCQPIFSPDGLAKILGISRATSARALKILLANNYIKKFGTCYFLNTPIDESQICDKSLTNETAVSEVSKESLKSEIEKSQKCDTNNNKEIKINNNFIFPEWLGEKGKEVALEYIQHRKEIKKPITPRGFHLQLKDYENSPDRFIAAAYNTIKHGWQRLVEPESNLPTLSHSPTKNNFPVAILKPDGSVQGDINFNTLPSNVKRDILLDNQLAAASAGIEERQRQRIAKMEQQNDNTQSNDSRVKNLVFNLSKRQIG